MMGVEMMTSFWAGAASAAGTGRRRPKGPVIKAAQFPCALEIFLCRKVEEIAPELTDGRLCQTAALPTVRRLCLTSGPRNQPNS